MAWRCPTEACYCVVIGPVNDSGCSGPAPPCVEVLKAGQCGPGHIPSTMDHSVKSLFGLGSCSCGDATREDGVNSSRVEGFLQPIGDFFNLHRSLFCTLPHLGSVNFEWWEKLR